MGLRISEVVMSKGTWLRLKWFSAGMAAGAAAMLVTEVWLWILKT